MTQDAVPIGSTLDETLLKEAATVASEAEVVAAALEAAIAPAESAEHEAARLERERLDQELADRYAREAATETTSTAQSINLMAEPLERVIESHSGRTVISVAFQPDEYGTDAAGDKVVTRTGAGEIRMVRDGMTVMAHPFEAEEKE